ncbi:twin transmembrane helix small protein [Sphingomonas sp. HF-S3]|uniref:Twin transmembrane helix small protein n=1 Tax=Sphingomonas rustica TaxID=3103142 RepID=A0ABV0B4N2_9SPHN
MALFLSLLALAAMLATGFVLIRGLVNMAGTTTTELEGDDQGPSERAKRSNKLMQQRIIFQAGAILLLALLLLIAQAGK